MLEISFPKSFGFSVGMLVGDARRLLRALNDETIGTPVVAYLSPTFVGEFSAQIALVAKLDLDQSGAQGSLGTLVLSRSESLVDFVRLSASARRAARLAFPGQTELLRNEFQVGVRGSRDLSMLVTRGRRLAGACHRYAEQLAPHGWTQALSDLFEQAVNGLDNVNHERLDVDQDKQSLTAGRIAAANRLYGQCVAVQNVARVVYARGKALADPEAVKARGRFLLGTFPVKALPADDTAPEGTTEPTTAPASA